MMVSDIIIRIDWFLVVLDWLFWVGCRGQNQDKWRMDVISSHDVDQSPDNFWHRISYEAKTTLTLADKSTLPILCWRFNIQHEETSRIRICFVIQYSFEIVDWLLFNCSFWISTIIIVLKWLCYSYIYMYHIGSISLLFQVHYIYVPNQLVLR
jgi:hypothetical protein